MAKYIVNISSEEDLKENWVDSSCPNFGFCFEQESIDDCVLNEDGTWQASYESMEITKPRVFSYLDMVNGGSITYTLEPGEYGIKP
tara:strand:+ start:1169 stop:1426 length:258 start_codon:yes stop_codon:yes gene_type:complete